MEPEFKISFEDFQQWANRQDWKIVWSQDDNIHWMTPAGIGIGCTIKDGIIEAWCLSSQHEITKRLNGIGKLLAKFVNQSGCDCKQDNPPDIPMDDFGLRN